MFSSGGGGGLFGNSSVSRLTSNPPPNTFGQSNFMFGQPQGPTTSVDHVGTPFTIKNRDGYLVASITASMTHLSLEELRINDHFAVKRGQIPDGKKQAIESLIQNNIRKRDDPTTATVTPIPGAGLFSNTGSNPYAQQGGIFTPPSNVVPGTTGGLFVPPGGSPNATNPGFANPSPSPFPLSGPYGPGLGLPSLTSTTGFSGFGTTLPQQETTTGGLFANKPATEAPTSGGLFSNTAGSAPIQGGFGLKSASPSLFMGTGQQGATLQNPVEQPKPAFLGQQAQMAPSSSVFGGGLQSGANIAVKPAETTTTQGQSQQNVVETKKQNIFYNAHQPVLQQNNPPVLNNTQNNQSVTLAKPQGGFVQQQSVQNVQSVLNVAPSLPQSQTVSSKPGGYAYEMNKMLFTYSLVELFGEHNIVYPEELLEETDFMPKLFDFLATYGIKPPKKFVPKFKMNKAAILSVVAPEDREAMREQEAKAQEVQDQQRLVVRQEVNNQSEEPRQEEGRSKSLFKVGEVNTKKEEKGEKNAEESGKEESEKEESAVVVGDGNSEKESESQGQTASENQ